MALGDSPLVMGIVNATPDSFFPASRSPDPEEAIARGVAHFRVGADVVDVGGESTRPGALEVDVAEELRRVVPVTRELARYGPVSIDTQKPEVARACVGVGATIVNDVSGTLMGVAGELGVGFVAMHRRGTSHTMQSDPVYTDVVSEVMAWLDEAAQRSRAAGVGQLWLDPGIGFGKTVQHNLSLLGALDQFVERAAKWGAGVLVGVSRKRFLAHLGNADLDVDERLEGSLAGAAWAIEHGVNIIRVHDVLETVRLRDLFVSPMPEVVS